jgi:hypothetical protein
MGREVRWEGGKERKEEREGGKVRDGACGTCLHFSLVHYMTETKPHEEGTPQVWCMC